MFRSTKSPVIQSIIYVIITYLFSWAFIFPVVLGAKFKIFTNAEFALAIVGGFGPTFGALITYYAFNGKNKTITWLKNCLNFKFGLLQFLMITLIPGLIVFLIYSIFNYQTGKWWNTLITLSPAMMINATFGIFNAGPIGEELGWRGFLTPVLLKKYSIGTVSIVVGVIWSFWHLPFFFIAEFRSNLSFSTYLMIYTIGAIFMSYTQIVISSVTKQSLIAAMLFHSVMNTLSSNVSDSSFFDIDNQNLGLQATLLYVPISMVVIAIAFTLIVNSNIFKQKTRF